MIYRTPQLGAEELRALERIAELHRQLRYVVAEPRRWIGSVRRVLAARAIQGSNSIEGIHVRWKTRWQQSRVRTGGSRGSRTGKRSPVTGER